MTETKDSTLQNGISIGGYHVLPPCEKAEGIRHSPFVIRHFLAAILFALTATSSLPAQSGAPAVTIPVKAAIDGRVWGALVYASDKKPEKESQEPEEFPNLFPRLAKVFPYRHFSILGEHTQVIFREYESWVVPSKDLFLKVDSRGAAKGGGINLNIQFWQGQQVLVKTDTVLRPSSPLFIAGPKWRDGRLVFVLDLKKVEARLRP